MQKIFSYILLYFFPLSFCFLSHCYFNYIVTMLSHILLQRADSVHDIMNQDEVIVNVEFIDRKIQDLLDFIESLSESLEEEVRE